MVLDKDNRRGENTSDSAKRPGGVRQEVPAYRTSSEKLLSVLREIFDSGDFRIEVPFPSTFSAKDCKRINASSCVTTSLQS
jgi:hypothetical protein